MVSKKNNISGRLKCEPELTTLIVCKSVVAKFDYNNTLKRINNIVKEAKM